MIQPARTKYTGTAIFLHWLIGIAIIAQIIVGLYMADLPKNTDVRSFWVNFHKSMGVTIALFVILRLWYRATHRPPTLEGIMAGWQVTMANIAHWLLYLCMILMPITGYIGSSFSKFGVKFWGIKLPTLFEENKDLREFWFEIHETVMWILVALIVVHVLAALKHLIVDKDGVFQRMTP